MGTILLIAAYLWVCAIIYLKLKHDLKKWKQGKTINHLKEWIQVAIASIPAIIVFKTCSPLPWYFSVPLSACMVMGFIWFFFDGLYNKKRGIYWWFTGTIGPWSSKVDVLLSKIPGWLHVVIKAAALTVPPTFYFVTR